MTGAGFALDRAAEATWPPARRFEVPGFNLREGSGGGQRVSAATARPGWQPDQIAGAEAGMRDIGQIPLFRVLDDEGALDAELARRGYTVVDPVVLLTADTGIFADIALPRVTAFCIWEPLAIQYELWSAGGIGPERRAVMARAGGPKTSVLGRIRDTPAGTAFAAVSDGTAFVHALHVLPEQRRHGLARWMMIAAAHWAAAEGATRIAVQCTTANAAAIALYTALGFAPSGGYHYRRKSQETP